MMMRRHPWIWVLLLALVLSYGKICLAEEQTFVADYTYAVGSGETRLSAENNAKLQASRIALEQAGTYIESMSEVRDFQLSKDVLSAVAAGIVKTTVLESRQFIENDVLFVYVKIQAQIDSDMVTQAITNKRSIDDYQRLQAFNDQLLQENDRLKQQLQSGQGSQEQLLITLQGVQKQVQANILLDQAYHMVQDGDYDQAIYIFTQVLRYHPDYAEAYNNRGAAYYYKNMLSQALYDYNMAVKFNPAYAEAYNNRGVMYFDLGHYDKAIMEFNQAVVLRPDHYEAYNNRGNAYCSKGLIDEALADFNRSLEIYPAYAVAYNNRGTAYRCKNMYDEALSDYSQALNLRPNFVQALVNRGRLYQSKDLLEAALADYNQALVINPVYADAYLYKAGVYEKTGYSRQAFEMYKLYLSYAKPDDPNVARVKTYLGWQG